MIESNRVSGDPSGSQPYVKRHKKLEICLVDKRTGEHKRISLSGCCLCPIRTLTAFQKAEKGGTQTSTARLLLSAG